MSKKILFIEDRIPYTFLGAGFPRSGKILSVLADLGHSVTFYPQKKDEYPEAFQDFQSNLPNVNFIIGDQYGKSGVEEYLRDTKGQFEIIVITRPKNIAYLAPILQRELKGIQTTIIYDAEAISSYREIMQKEVLGGFITDEEKLESVEAELSPAKVADIIWTVSENERNNFLEYGFVPEKVKVVGHTSEIKVDNRSFHNRRNLLFIGAIHGDTTPNAHSVQWFSQYVLPKLTEEIPDIALNVVGINSSPVVTSLSSKHLIFHGRVDSTDSFYSNSRVFIAPTHFAAGIPLKIIEAASRGIPIATTPMIADQLGMSDGINILVAEDPKEFLRNIQCLYSDESLWYSIRENALGFIRDNYSETRFIQDVSNAIST